MVGPSKILTVSYGTFSCTLEGFDEPFNTMKAIAEYFRDLAADDRYFGAEPPTPDAEMLHRIAEREIQRRVEAKISEHGVVLRQTQATPEPAVVAPAAIAAPVVAAAAAEPAAEVMVKAEEPAPAPVADDIAEDDPILAADAIDLAVTEAADDLTDEPVAEVMAEAQDDTAPDMELPEDEIEAEDISLDSIMAAVQVDPTPEANASQPEAEEPAPDSLAAKLQRIRAVVETVRAGQPAAYEEDEPTDLQPASAETFDADFGFDLDMSEDVPELVAAEAARAAARPQMDAPEEAEAAVVLEDTDEDDLSFLDEDEDDKDVAEAPEAVTEAAAAPVTEYDDAEEDIAQGEDHDLLARLSDLAQSTAAQPDEAPVVPEAPKAAATARADFDEDDTDMDDSAHDDLEDVAEDHPSFFERARARVIRIGKVAHILSNTKPDDQAEIVDESREDAPAHADHTHEEHAHFSDGQDEPADDVERLMEEAKTKLEGAENRRRFSAIAHLKAAVAATLADRKMQPTDTPAQAQGETEPEMELYRDDLSKAVRPRRPAAEAGATTRRPTLDTRPAPLVLVSEQRVDRADDPHRDAAAIRPRRVSAGNLSSAKPDEDRMEDEDQGGMTPETASNFAEFAEGLGAHSLTELLEAAAVYTSSVEGQTHFTRPQLLRKVEFVSSRGDYNREDGLRSFGMLLRQGKIQKVAPGQFAIADASKFGAEARRAAH